MQQMPGGQPGLLSRPRLGPLARAGIPLSSLGALAGHWLVYAMDANCRGISPVIPRALISAGGGYKNATGYVLGLSFMVAICLLSAVVLLFVTRETVGRFKGRDFGVFSPERCNVDLSTTEEVRS